MWHSSCLSVLLAAGGFEQAQSAAEVSPIYAESAAIGGISADAEKEFSIRIGRYPGRSAAALSVSVVVAGQRYAVSDGDLDLGSFTGRTPVEDAEVAFEVHGTSSGRIECRNRHTDRMVCAASAAVLAHESNHPPPGRGTVPVRIEVTFRSSHRPVAVTPSRFEAMGVVTATIVTPSGAYQMEAPGRWHEQTGERPRFGSAFTYLNVQSPSHGLLARTGPSGSWGFFREGKKVTPVTDFRIDPLGGSRRRFGVTLSDERRIEGEALVKLQASGPIEGKRRPGATVVVHAKSGEMVGHLNDWED